ncbi:PAS domain-containing protein [Vibrio algarum]|uniref:PAS domain-containing protein n=1 Tax=Vibrio algarum TaxID=3020714 RepID=A0ABT4YXM2_9VIBR|nr:PAS domain-containing protein [Vibrio sp. KJ40-1]MDB1125759.1 PAS domain-containing protein [Vibrio sp. KJ40-1]
MSRRQMNEPLSESIEHIIQQGLDVSPDCFGILNPEGKVIFCNNTFADAYGVSKEAAIGKSNKELLKLAWKNKKGITINTDDFELWYKKIEELYREKTEPI